MSHFAAASSLPWDPTHRRSPTGLARHLDWDSLAEADPWDQGSTRDQCPLSSTVGGPKDAGVSVPELRFRTGFQIYPAGVPGHGWRLRSGAVRLDRPTPEGTRFAGLALPGDLIGIEAFVTGTYGYAAAALAPCAIAPWPGGPSAPAVEDLLLAFARAQSRSADSIALRAGPAAERVWALLRILAVPDPEGRLIVILPARRDMAEITALTVETSSRVLSVLRRSGRLGPPPRGCPRRALVMMPAGEGDCSPRRDITDWAAPGTPYFCIPGPVA